MLKIYVQHAHENWIVDRIAEEFMSATSLQVVYKPEEADVIWLMAPYAFFHIDRKVLQEKFVIATQHHIVPEKFVKDEFLKRHAEAGIDAYFTYDPLAQRIISNLISVPCVLTSHWCHPNFFQRWEAEKTLGYLKNDRTKKFDPLIEALKNPEVMVFGSFQRDTERNGQPKLEKGPDRLMSILKGLKKLDNNFHVVLAGYRRDWLISQLEKEGMDFSYYERCSPNDLLALYNAIHMYLVTSRYEGGPQAIYEAALTQTPILSMPVGSAPRVLHPFSICKDENDMFNRLFSLEEKDIANMIKYNFASAISFGYDKMIKVYDDLITNMHKECNESPVLQPDN